MESREDVRFCVPVAVSPKWWLISGLTLKRHSNDDWNLCCQKGIIKRVNCSVGSKGLDLALFHVIEGWI